MTKQSALNLNDVAITTTYVNVVIKSILKARERHDKTISSHTVR